MDILVVIDIILAKLRINRYKAHEFIKFCVVGTSGIFVNMGMLFVLTRYLSLKIEFASPIAIEISIITNFFLNNYWTFIKRNTRINFIPRLFRYHLVTGLAGIVNYLTLIFLVRVFHINEMLANLAGIFLGTVINFILNSLWTWKVNR